MWCHGGGGWTVGRTTSMTCYWDNSPAGELRVKICDYSNDGLKDTNKLFNDIN